jgi:hypothetical protein
MSTVLLSVLLPLLLCTTSVVAAAANAHSSLSFVTGPWALTQHGYIITFSFQHALSVLMRISHAGRLALLPCNLLWYQRPKPSFTTRCVEIALLSHLQCAGLNVYCRWSTIPYQTTARWLGQYCMISPQTLYAFSTLSAIHSVLQVRCIWRVSKDQTLMIFILHRCRRTLIEWDPREHWQV